MQYNNGFEVCHILWQEISVSPVKGDLFHWNATIRPKDSLWEGINMDKI